VVAIVVIIAVLVMWLMSTAEGEAAAALNLARLLFWA